MSGEESGPSARHRLERELDYYKRELNELGAKHLRLQEEHSQAFREERRARAMAKLIREAYRLSDYGGPDADADRIVLTVVLENALCDRVLLLRERRGGGALRVEAGLGGDDLPLGREVALRRPPRFLFTAGAGRSESGAAELAALAGTPYLLWAFDPGSGYGMLLANRHEGNVSRPFEAADRDLVETALSVYLDVLHRRRELRLSSRILAEHGAPSFQEARAEDGEEGEDGIQEAEIREGLRAGGRVSGLLVVDRSGPQGFEFVTYVRVTWARGFRLLRTFRQGDRIYRDVARLFQLAREDFGYDAPITVYAAGAPELHRFPGIWRADLRPVRRRCGERRPGAGGGSEDDTVSVAE